MKNLYLKFKYYLISFLIVSIIAFLFVYLQHLSIIPQQIQTGPFYYRFHSFDEFTFHYIFTLLLLYIVPVSARIVKKRKIDIICPKCEYPSNTKKSNHTLGVCPKCGTKMVPLKGFYDKKR